MRAGTGNFRQIKTRLPGNALGQWRGEGARARRGNRRSRCDRRCRHSRTCGGGGRSHRSSSIWRRCGAHVLALLRDDGDKLIHRHIIGARRHDDFGQNALVNGLNLHCRLIGFDFGQHVTGLDLIAFFFQPFGEISLFHGG